MSVRRCGVQGVTHAELPPLQAIFGGVSPSLAADIVAVWMFLQLFGEPLKLSSIGLDDFAAAITYTGGDNAVVVHVRAVMLRSSGPPCFSVTS